MIENLTCVLLVNDISCVTGLDPAKLAFLHTLELRGNKLETTAGITLPTLKNLFLVRFPLKFHCQCNILACTIFHQPTACKCKHLPIPVYHLGCTVHAK